MKSHQTKEKPDLRKFGIVFGIALLFMGTIQLLKRHTGAYFWFYGIGTLVLILGIFTPAILKPMHFLLNKISHTAGTFTTTLILIAVFYAVLTPISLIMKLLGNSFLDTKLRKEDNTYWIKKQTLNEGKLKYEKQF